MPMPEKFIITFQAPADKPCTMTIHVPRKIRDSYDELAQRTNIPRDELAGRALQFALEHMELQEQR